MPAGSENASSGDAPTGAASALTPAQHRTLTALRRSGAPVVFDPDVVADIRAGVLHAMDELAQRLERDRALFVSKHRLASALGCEAQHLAADDFAWTPARARGQIAHRALQLMVWWRGEPTSVELVDEAMARMADDDNDYSGIGAWIAGLGPGDAADVRGQATERVTKFRECFPPLDHRSRPVTESRTRWPTDGPIVLQGQADLTIGRPRERESTKVIIDFKTGGTSPRHRQDLGFYAVIETVSREVPPRKLATLYLDTAETQAEDVSERLLRTAVRRTLDGVNAMIELEIEGRPPVKRPGVSCRWCSLRSGCEEGRAHLAGTGDHDG